MASQAWMLLLLVLGTSVIALVPAARMVNQESLRSALDAVTRKQRSLDAADSPEYYNDLHSFKYHGGDTDRKFDRDFDENDEEIEFLPGSLISISNNGQLETAEDGFQDPNNKLLARALLDYLESLPEQEEPIASIFRERERSGSRKRGGVDNHLNPEDKDLERLSVEELQDDSLYNPLDVMDADEYLTTLQQIQTLYDRYMAGRGNKVYETAGPMSWGELLSKGPLKSQTKIDGNNEFVDRNQDQNVLYLQPTKRRNVNGRYPIGREYGSFRKLTKRYPVAKRSPKPIQTKLKTTDPKVAQDLGALFGTQSADTHNRTYISDHDHKHDYDHDHDHDHDHNHNHDHDHNHEHDHDHNHGHESSSETPLTVTSSSKGQKENATKTDKSEFVQVRKKSVDWSQYFGIDRRKKKATFMAGQGTPNQDDEWMLQRYYENMAENLKPKDEASDRKDKFEQIDSKLNYIKDLIIEEAMKYTNLEEPNLQKVKDKLMTQMAAAYSLQKMRKALSDLRNNIADQKEAQKMQMETQNNLTSNFRENSNSNGNPNVNIGGRSDDKRSDLRNNIDDGELIEEPRSCPELEAIELRCRAENYLARDASRMLYVPCVKLQICKVCAQDAEALLPCLRNYAMEAIKVCDMLDSREGQEETVPRLMTAREVERQSCPHAALMLSEVYLPPAMSSQCRMQNPHESCLRRYYMRYEHRFRTSPAYESSGRRPHHASALDALQQTMSER